MDSLYGAKVGIFLSGRKGIRKWIFWIIYELEISIKKKAFSLLQKGFLLLSKSKTISPSDKENYEQNENLPAPQPAPPTDSNPPHKYKQLTTKGGYRIDLQADR